MATGGIDDAHERLQPVEDPSPLWSDSMYFNAWDPGTDAFVLARVAVHPNTDRIVGGLLVWRDGVIAHAYGIDQPGIPPSDWDVMAAGALTVRMLAAGQCWAVQLSDADTLVHLEWDGLSPATLYAAHPAGPIARAVGWGHYEQSCRCARTPTSSPSCTRPRCASRPTGSGATASTSSS